MAQQFVKLRQYVSCNYNNEVHMYWIIYHFPIYVTSQEECNVNSARILIGIEPRLIDKNIVRQAYEGS